MDFTECQPTTLSAVGGLLNVLIPLYDTDDGQLQKLSDEVYFAATRRFREAAGEAEEEQWLRTLYHLVDDEDCQFADVDDDEEYDLLEAKRSRVCDRWNASVATALTAGDAPLWASFPLAERLHRLCWLYGHTDVCDLSKGDDEQVRRLLTASRQCLDRCRDELMNDSSLFALHLSLYYTALCSICPGKRNLAHLPYYKELFQTLVVLGSPNDEAFTWQAREIEAHYHLAPMHRADRYVLPGLAVIDPDACRFHRLKAYMLWALLDPDDDNTLQDEREQQEVMARANGLVTAYLRAKRDHHVSIPMSTEAEALITRLASANNTACGSDFDDLIVSRAYALLPLLPDGRQKTVLAALLGWYADDSQLLAQAETAVATWPQAIDYTAPDELFVRSIIIHRDR